MKLSVDKLRAEHGDISFGSIIYNLVHVPPQKYLLWVINYLQVVLLAP